MNKGVYFRLFWFFGLFVFFFAGVFALHIVTNSLTGTSSFGTINEELSTLYNITLNNTDTGGAANLTQLNITLPSNFSFVTGSANLSVAGYVFVNTSSVLSFSNGTGLVLNSTRHFFWFNASASVPGNYNFTLITVNSSSVVYQNLSVLINDTTPPQPVSFNAPGATGYLNVSATAIAINASAYDEGTLGTINITLYNATVVLNSTNGSSNLASHFVNFTGLSEGVYFVNISANDSNGNVNTSVSPLRIALDTSAPTVSLSEVSSNRTAINISISISDTVTGAAGTCTSISGGGTISGNGSTQYLYRTGLDCGEDYTFNVSCVDYVSNTGYGSGSFSTDSCASSGGGSSGGGGGSSGGGTSYWENTLSVSSSDFSLGYSTVLKEKERLRISIGGSDHHVGVVDIDPSDVTINVSSTPQQAVLRINGTKLFEVTDDSYYDISVTLNDINSSRTGANITVISVHELTPAGAAALGALNSTSNQSTNSTRDSSTGALFSENSWWIWVVLALALVALVLVAWRLYDRHQRLKGFRTNDDSS